MNISIKETYYKSISSIITSNRGIFAHYSCGGVFTA